MFAEHNDCIATLKEKKKTKTTTTTKIGQQEQLPTVHSFKKKQNKKEMIEKKSSKQNKWVKKGTKNVASYLIFQSLPSGFE